MDLPFSCIPLVHFTLHHVPILHDQPSLISIYAVHIMASTTYISQAMALLSLLFFVVFVNVEGRLGNGNEESQSTATSIKTIRHRRKLQLTKKLEASDRSIPSKRDFFGQALSMDGNILIVGAFNKAIGGNQGQGQSYISTRDSYGTWAEEAKITAKDGTIGDHFGFSVDISGNHVAVGAYGDDDAGISTGAVYIFERSTAGKWKQSAKLTALDKHSFDHFGYAVSIDGNYAVVGSHRDDDAGKSSGAAYVFEKNIETGEWNQNAKLTSNDPSPYDFMGYSG